MDLWDFRQWRKQLGYTQAVAAEKLGLSRGAVQYWESETRSVPRAVELACKELVYLWRQRPEFGPVTLLYGDLSTTRESFQSGDSIILRVERHANNKDALERLTQLAKTSAGFHPLILEDDGGIIWSGSELLREIDARKK